MFKNNNLPHKNDQDDLKRTTALILSGESAMSHLNNIANNNNNNEIFVFGVV